MGQVCSGLRQLSSTPSKIVKRRSLLKGFAAASDWQKRRLRALESLIESMDPGLPLPELMCRLTRGLVLPSSEKMFAKEDVISASYMTQALESGLVRTASDSSSSDSSPPNSGRPNAADTSALAAKVLRLLAESAELEFDEVLGQLIFRHRRTEALSTAHKKVIHDLDWATKAGNEATAPGLLDSVEETFRSLAKGPGGRMNSMQWRKVIHLIQANPVLKARMRHEDADRLFWSETHQGGEAQRGVNLLQFRSLLAQLAECWQVHPYTVFLAVGSHVGHLDAEKEEEEE